VTLPLMITRKLYPENTVMPGGSANGSVAKTLTQVC
jgi:hypothetical protein